MCWEHSHFIIEDEVGRNEGSTNLSITFNINKFREGLIVYTKIRINEDFQNKDQNQKLDCLISIL